MSQVALVAEFEVSAGDLDRFLSAAKSELEAVRASEPGCLRFDVVLFDEEPGNGVFIEVFEDQAASTAHRSTPHFEAFFRDISGIDVKWHIRRGTALSSV